jgi:hypothetical protein
MPRFFFHNCDGEIVHDRDGVELADDQAARAHALRAAADAIRKVGDAFWNSPEWETWVTDESGATVCSLTVLARTPGEPSPSSD